MKFPLATFRLLAVLICVVALLMFGATILRGGDKETSTPLRLRATTFTAPAYGRNNTPERIHEVRLRHDDLFWRQPNIHAVGEGFFMSEDGGWLDIYGIVLEVSTLVDQNTLPEADRIPLYIEGIPIQIVDRSYAVEGNFVSGPAGQPMKSHSQLRKYYVETGLAEYPDQTLEELRAQLAEEKRRRWLGLVGWWIDWRAEEKWRRWGFGLFDRWIDWWAE